MLSKNKAKYIQSLLLKKNRQEEGCFIAEGEKILLEVLTSDWEIKELFVTIYFEEKYKSILSKYTYELVTEKELEKTGSLESNNSGIAVLNIKNSTINNLGNQNIVLVLDGINDPGNLGTIIRIADWYGIDTIICSNNTVDVYNPKVIMSSKGSFLRVNVIYADLKHYLSKVPSNLIFGTFMQGESIHSVSFPNNSYLVMGSESHGISADIAELINNKITINGAGRTESLNVSIATAICLDNFFRVNS